MADHHELADELLVAAVLDGDSDAYTTLFERWFDRVHDVARNIVRDSDTAADVAQDTFIAVWERLDQLERHEAFGGWLLRTARNRALNRLERERRSRPLEDDLVTGLHDRGAQDHVGSHRSLDPEEITASRDRDGLVHAAAVALGERDASLLDLHLRHGLSPAEIAGELGVPANTAHQQLFRMRTRLGDAIGAFVLWRRGQPTCAALAATVDGGVEFDSDVFAAVERHRRTCEECSEQRDRLVAADQLFVAAPVVAVPLALRDRVLGAVRDAVANGSTGAGAGADADADADVAGDVVGDDDGNVVGRGRRRRLVAAGLVVAVLIPTSVVVGTWLTGSDDRLAPGSAEPNGAAAIGGSSIFPAGAPPGSVPNAGVEPADLGSSDAGAPRAGAPMLVESADAEQRSGDPDGDPSGLVPPTDPADAPPGNPEPPPEAVPPSGSSTTTTAIADPLSATPVAPTPNPPAPPAPVTTTTPALPTTTVVLPATTVLPTTTTVPPPSPQPNPPPTTTTTTTPPPAVPKITSFTVGAGPGGLLCGLPDQAPRRFQWTSVNATSGALVVGGIVRQVAASGSYDLCAASGALADITVTGPGGSDSGSLVVP